MAAQDREDARAEAISEATEPFRRCIEEMWEALQAQLAKSYKICGDYGTCGDKANRRRLRLLHAARIIQGMQLKMDFNAAIDCNGIREELDLNG